MWRQSTPSERPKRPRALCEQFVTAFHMLPHFGNSSKMITIFTFIMELSKLIHWEPFHSLTVCQNVDCFHSIWIMYDHTNLRCCFYISVWSREWIWSRTWCTQNAIYLSSVVIVLTLLSSLIFIGSLYLFRNSIQTI